MRLGVRARLVVWFMVLIGASAVVADAYLARSLEELLTNRISSDLRVRLELIEREASSQILSLDDRGSWGAIATDFARRSNVQVTIVSARGDLLGDSEPVAGGLARAEELASQPEISEALSHGFGQSTRHSQSLDQQMMFVAAPFRWEDVVIGVVRLGLPVAEVHQAVGQLRRNVLLAGILTLMLAGLGTIAVAQLVSRRVRSLTRTASRMAQGDLSARTGVGASRDELSELGRTLDRLAESLSGSLDALRSERDLVRRLESVRRDFVTNVSHELKTPLTAISSATETLRAGAIRDPLAAAEFLEMVARNAQRLQLLVADLLELARVESGELKLKPVPVELSAAVLGCVAQFVPTAAEKGVQLSFAEGTGSTQLTFDPRAFGQVLGNFVDNAVKFCPRGSTVTVRALAEPALVRVTVEDDGPGIAAEHLPRLFERFYRVDDSRSRDVGGSGLGLAIARHLVEAMGGTFGVDSAVGRGSTFWFTLPRR